jgi:hypothetical protein
MDYKRETTLLKTNMRAKLQEYTELTQFLGLKLGSKHQVVAEHMRAIIIY